jgi:hypothetical protein
MAAGLTVLLVLVAVRLAMGPVPVGFLSPHIESALSTADGSYDVEITETVIAWAGWDRTIDVIARGVRVSDAKGAEQASIPEVSISFSLRALLKLEIAPRRLQIFRPRIQVVRREDGSIVTGTAVARPEAAEPPAEAPAVEGATNISPQLTTDFIGGLLAPSGAASVIGHLESVNITDAELTFEDRRSGVRVHAPEADLVLVREPDGIGGNARITVAAGNERMLVDLSAGYSLQRRAVELEARFTAAKPAALTALGSKFTALAGLKVPLSGRITLTSQPGVGIDRFTLDVNAGAGEVAIDAVPDGKVDITSASLKAEARGDFSQFTLSALKIDLGDTNIAATGKARLDEGVLDAEVKITSGGLAVSRLQSLWPRGAAEGGRSWVVANFRGGAVTNASFSIGLAATIGGAAGIEAPVIKHLDGRFGIAKTDVHHLRPLPPLKAISGSARVTAKEIVIDTKGGTVGGLTLGTGRVRLYGLEKEDEFLALEMVVGGPLKNALAQLDHPRLNLLKGMNISPPLVGGDAAARLVMGFPLIQDLKFADIDINVASNLRGVSLPKVALGADLEGGDMQLQLDKHGMDVTGTATIGGVKTELVWTENFDDKVPYRSRYVVKGMADDAGRRRFGFDFSDYVDGPLGTELIITRFDKKRTGVAVVLDLKPAALKYDDIFWSKPADVPGFARFHISLDGERMNSIEDLFIKAGDLVAQGELGFAPGRKLPNRFNFSRVVYGENDFSAKGQVATDDTLNLEVNGSRLDARPYIAGDSDDTPAKPLDLKLNVASLRVASGPAINDVKGEMQLRDDRWQKISLNGRVGKNNKPLVVQIAPEGSGRTLTVRSEDASGVMKSLGVTENMVGGVLEGKGSFDDAKPSSPFSGRVHIKKFRMVKGSALAKVLSVLSLTGILDALRGQGIDFQEADVPFTKTGDIVTIENSRIYGPALGITAQGEVNFPAETLKLKGTVVPAYSLNAVFGKIPFLGRILTGEKGSGIFAAKYSMEGKITDPRVSVNPLATLTPGFLRDVFNIFDDPKIEAPTGDDAADGQGKKTLSAPPKKPAPEPAPNSAPEPVQTP